MIPKLFTWWLLLTLELAGSLRNLVSQLELFARGQSMVGTAFPSMKLVGHFWSKPIPRNRSPRDAYLKCAARYHFRIEWIALPGTTISGD